MEKSVLIICHGNNIPYNNFFIPQNCNIYTCTPSNNILYSNNKKITKLLNNLRYCNDDDYISTNYFFGNQHIHKWEPGQYIPNMKLNFNCNVVSTNPNNIYKTCRHGILRFDDESPGIIFLDEDPNQLEHMLYSKELEKQNENEYTKLYNSLAGYNDDGEPHEEIQPIYLFNIIQKLKHEFDIENFIIVACRTNINNSHNLQTIFEQVSEEIGNITENNRKSWRVQSHENSSNVKLKRTSSLYKPMGASMGESNKLFRTNKNLVRAYIKKKKSQKNAKEKNAKEKNAKEKNA